MSNYSGTIRGHFNTLELSETATLKEVKEAYHELVRIWHPDHYLQDEKLKIRAERKTRELNLAMEALKEFFAKGKHRTEFRATSNKAESSSTAAQHRKEAAKPVRYKPLWLITLPGFLRSLFNATQDLLYFPLRTLQFFAGFFIFRLGFQLASVCIAFYLLGSAGNFGPIKEMRRMVKSATAAAGKEYKSFKRLTGSQRPQKTRNKSSKNNDKGVFEVLDVFEQIRF